MNCECVICKNQKPFSMPNEIIIAAQKGELVLFCGAGISTENKTVLPFSFYADIQQELGATDNTLSFCELIQKYCDLPNGRRKLLKKIRSRFEYIHSFPELEHKATRFHRELSELYFIKTIITTNWDTYFEEYCVATPITIPEDFVFWDESERCVLKIHGSINNLSTIIATKDDYNKCTENLNKGIMGAILKTILATKTIIFIGFSFGDEDFAQILEYLSTEMKNIFPHIYIVTLDDQISTKLNYNNSTYIFTDGTYFLHQLKLTMIEKKLIVNCNLMPIIEIVNDLVKKLHKMISDINFKKYPCVIFCLAYQDGMLHAFDKFIQLYAKGDYNTPGLLESSTIEYSKITQEHLESKNYWDHAYYKGYLNGLILLASCEKNRDIIKKFPLLYLPNTNRVLNSYDIFIEELFQVTEMADKYHQYAVSITSNYENLNTVIHHPPY